MDGPAAYNVAPDWKCNAIEEAREAAHRDRRPIVTTIDLLIERLVAARRWTTNLLADIEESRWFECPAPGIQHVAWQMGHLAASQAVLIHNRCLNIPVAEVVPESFTKQFGRGSKPVGIAAEYPPLLEIRRMFDGVQEDCLTRIRQMTQSDLELPAYGDPHPMFAKRGEAVGMAAMHEAFHAGQIALTRRLFGKAALR